MKHFIWTLLSVLGCCLPTMAVTVDQLVGSNGTAIVDMYGSFKVNSRNFLNYGVEFVKVDDRHVKICHTYYRDHDFTFELVKNDRFTTDGDQLRIYYDNTDSQGWKIEAGYTYSGWSGTVYNFTTLDYTYFNIVDNGDGTYTLTSTTPILFADPSRSDVPYFDIYDKIVYRTIKTNATATQNWRKYNYSYGSNYITIRSVSKSAAETYNLWVDLDMKNRTLSFVNLGRNGEALDQSHNQSPLTGTFTADGKITMDANQYAYISDSWGTTSGGWGGSSSTNFKGFSYFYLTGFNYASSPSFPTLNGQLTLSDVPNHNDEPVAWVTNGGKKRTLVDFNIKLDPFTYYSTSSLNSNYTRGMDFRGEAHFDTNIDGETDITLESDLKINALGADENNVYINASVATVANGDFVDHYELCIVPGVYSDINDNNFVYHDETGHSDATVLSVAKYATEFGTNPKSRIIDAKNAQTVNILVPVEDLKAKSPDNTYSFFLKATYANHLTPTYHNLTVYQGEMTSVDDIVYGNEDNSDDAPIYTITGVRVKDMSQPGIYVQNGKKYIVR